MNKYLEFSVFERVEDKKNPFCHLYKLQDGELFYVEPLFYSYLQNFKIQYANKVQDVIDEMVKIVKRNKKVIFTGMDEEYEEDPVTVADGFIILTLFDVLDRMGIYLENKSRGSDYGD